MHLLLAAVAAASLRTAAQPGLDAIHPDALSAHVRFLADDLLEGRGTGTRGHAIAARYAAAQLQALGISPAGGDGGWFQKVPLTGMTYDETKSGLTVSAGGKSRSFRAGEEVLLRPSVLSPDADVTGGLVYVGYGVAAPPYRYDDAAIDLKGKIAILLPGAPRGKGGDFLPPAASAIYSDAERKSRLLAERGAVGLIAVATPEFSSYAPWDAVRRNGQFEQMGQASAGRAASGVAIPAALVSMAGLDEILKMAGADTTAATLVADAEAGRARPLALDARGSMTVRCSAVRPVVSENVIGILRGSDPALAAEYVVVSAHLDHLGIGPEVNGDAIYNGAEDDASGVAAVLEIARAFASLPSRPRRSILFALFTAEEKGLAGSLWFVDHPTVPAASIVADVNVDSAPGRWRPHDMVPRGAEHASLMRDARLAAEVLGLAVSPDPEPQKLTFLRSDQYSFVRAGIPAVLAGPGFKDAAGDEAKNRANNAEFFRSRYHQPSDEWDSQRDYRDMAVEARYQFLLAFAVAQENARPAWNEGDVLPRIFPRVSSP